MVGVTQLLHVGRGLELSDGLREHVSKRLEFAIGRFATRVRRVRVRVADVNGPRGGVDMQCRIDVALDGLEPIVITELAEDLYVAIDSACDRLGRVVARRVERQTEHGRHAARRATL